MKKNLLFLLCIIFLSACKEDETNSLSVTVGGSTHFSSNGGVLSLSIVSNTSWSITGATGWCTVLPQSGSGDGTATVMVAKTTDMSERSVTLIIKADGVDPYSVKIEQDRMAAAISVDKPTLSFVLAGGGQALNITANVAWTIELEKLSPWCHLSIASGSGNASLTINTDPSTDVEARESVLILKGVGVATPIRINVIQLGEGASILVSPAQKTITYDMQNIEVTTTSNISYAISYSPSSTSEWLSEVVSPSPLTKNFVQKAHTFKVVANGTRANRTAEIIFTNTTENVKDTCTLTQEVQPASFSVSHTALTYGAKENLKTFEVTSNVAWSAAVKSSDASWCALSISSADANDANKIITVTLSGTNLAGRQTEITFTGQEIVTPVVITLSQDAPPPAGAKGDSIALAAIYTQSIQTKAWDASLKWDLEDEQMKNWKGVQVNAAGRVVGLTLGSGTVATKWVYLNAVMDFEPLDALESLILYPLSTGIIGSTTNPRIESILPSSIFTLVNLKTLIIAGNIDPKANNSAAVIPVTINNLTKLERLIIKGGVDHNFYGSIFPAINNLTALKSLQLVKTNFGGEFPTIGNLANLDSLWIEKNAFTNFPSQLGNLTNLSYFVVTSNTVAIGTLPASIGALTKLKHMNIATNKFAGTLPTEIGNLAELNYLNVSNNGFTESIPGSLGNLKKLKELFLSNNSFSGVIPSGLGGMEALEKFYMASNALEFTGGLPSTIGNLTNLILLDVSKSVMRNGTLPRELGNLTNLTSLLVNGDSLVGIIPKELSNLKKIGSAAYNFQYNNFTEIEEGFIGFGGVNIISLNFQYNKLNKIPKDLANTGAASLTLNLSYNKLTTTSFPAEFGSAKLTSLDIGNNEMETIPDCIFSITSLTSLNMSVNKLKVFPEGLRTLINLTNLNLYKNEMTGSIPDIFGPEGISKLTQYGFSIKGNLFITDLPCPHTLRDRTLPYRAANVHDQSGDVAKPFTFTTNLTCTP